MPMDPLLSALEEDYVLPATQSIANAAIIAVFAYIVPLLTMEINFFRLAVYKSWRRQVRSDEKKGATSATSSGVAAAGGSDDSNNEEPGESSPEADDLIVDDAANGVDGGKGFKTPMSRTESTGDLSAVGYLMNDVGNAIHDSVVRETQSCNDPALQKAYISIRHASMQAILSSLLVYFLTALGIALSTRGLDERSIAIIAGASQFMAALIVFIVSAKVPQWIGVYHEGAIRLVKCSSNYSQHFERIDLHDDKIIKKLRSNVRLGVWFHFSKFYIILMPFYCGVQKITIPLSIISGAVFGFILMWAVFVVHERWIHHRNIVSFTTISLLSIISAFCFVKGMAWIQIIWKQDILTDEDALLVISFFTWLGLLAGVHTLFIWHTLRTEKRKDGEAECEDNVEDDPGRVGGQQTPKTGKSKGMRKTFSYSSFVFDPRTHFKDGMAQFSDHPDLEDDFTNDIAAPTPDALAVTGQAPPMAVDDEDSGNCMETPVVADNTGSEDETDYARQKENSTECCPAWCQVLICFSPEYQQSSCLWKIIVWIKILILTLTYLLCLYFVAVSIGATYQISETRAILPAVQEALYSKMNEGSVCAFDNQGPDSNITTFEDRESAHEAGFLVVHCGACSACSSWENLNILYTTRNNMAALANQCAKEALFGGGDDALLSCLMDPKIGFERECAICWQEDIICTKEHCSFLFLQSQMINNVGNFAVGPNEITSASCEEAHCEVGQFVPCSGATRRRMNIVSSISRPGDQQCGIVDVEDWEDLFFGSGVA